MAVAASFSVRQEGYPAYSAAKAGIVGLAQNFAREFYAHNIRVNTIVPGLFRARLADGPVAAAPADLARTGHPEDIAYAALYLASDEARWVTGQVLAVDPGGGRCGDPRPVGLTRGRPGRLRPRRPRGLPEPSPKRANPREPAPLALRPSPAPSAAR